MNHEFVFTVRAEYSLNEAGITIETTLSVAGKEAVTQAKVDTGAQLCLFQREIGEQLGLDIESGHRRSLDTLAGSLIAYGHPITLHTLGLEFDSVAYFAASPGLSRNLLGREGWMNKIRLALVDYDAALYLSHYDFT